MEYVGKLYGKIGRKYFETGKTSKDWDEVENKLKECYQMIEHFKVTLMNSTIQKCNGDVTCVCLQCTKSGLLKQLNKK